MCKEHIVISKKEQFDQLATWEKYEILEYLEKMHRQNCIQVQVYCRYSINKPLKFHKINIIKSETIDCDFHSPLELLNIFDG